MRVTIKPWTVLEIFPKLLALEQEQYGLDVLDVVAEGGLSNNGPTWRLL